MNKTIPNENKTEEIITTEEEITTTEDTSPPATPSETGTYTIRFTI
jgi:hypothetical protein